MPSTYTPNLGIQKPGPGEQDGIWGSTVNVNSDIFDRAINGVLPLVLTGTASTLTTSDGVVSDGQYKLLALGGTPSGTHTITIEPNDAQKIYYVANASTQSVIFAQGSGPTYTLPSGDSAIVYAFGTGAGSGVSNLADYFAMSSPRITGGTITGITDLAVADGGTGASTAAAALTNFGLTATAAEINTLDNINTAGNFGLVPSGGIIIWSGSSAAIPSGWLLCDGTNSTPNLLDRFVVGAGSTYAVGNTGGAATVTLATANLPSHTHGVNITSGGQSADHSHQGYTGGMSANAVHSHTIAGTMTQPPRFQDGGNSSQIGHNTTGTTSSVNLDHTHGVQTYGVSANHTHNINGTSDATGSGTAHQNLPPYYALCYIMKS